MLSFYQVEAYYRYVVSGSSIRGNATENHAFHKGYSIPCWQMECQKVNLSPLIFPYRITLTTYLSTFSLF